MIGCGSLRPQDTAKLVDSRYAVLHGFYLVRKFESCGQAEGNVVHIDGSTTMVASPEKCKEACWLGYGAKTCHGFTYDKQTSKCTFHWDALKGKRIKKAQ